MQHTNISFRQNALEARGFNLSSVTCSCDNIWHVTWWRHQMETFSALLAICAGNSPVTGEFPAQSPMMRSFDVFFDLRLNKRLSKQWWGWWFATPSRPSWRHCNELKCHDADWLFSLDRRYIIWSVVKTLIKCSGFKIMFYEKKK